MLDFKVFFLALAVSIDGFGVGLSCGIRRLIILPFSLLVICFCSSGAVALSMFLGQGVGVFVPVSVASTGGGILLLFLGLYFVAGTVKGLICPGSTEEEDGQTEPGNMERGRLERFCYITREPREADLDHSGTLSAGEAVLLGTALAADAFGAGFGAVLLGLNPVVTVIAVGLTKLLLVPAGVLVGRLFKFVHLSKYSPLLSGCILIFLGLTAFF